MSPAWFEAEDNGDGKATFRMFGTDLNICLRSPAPATIVKTDETTIVTVSPTLRGCDEFRLFIINDGSGVQRQVKVGSDWTWDEQDRGITPRK
jgi:hypothetical protein